MNDKLHFAVDLYQGTAKCYDRYRLPCAEAMIEDLIARAQVSGQGRLLDLACGTGQLTFPLCRSFAEVWAVDREPDFVQMVQAKADKLGAPDRQCVRRLAGQVIDEAHVLRENSVGSGERAHRAREVVVEGCPLVAKNRRREEGPVKGAADDGQFE